MAVLMVSSLSYGASFDIGNKTNPSQFFFRVLDTGWGWFNNPLNMTNNRITNVAAPIASTDAATKAYVDAAGSCSTVPTFEGFTTTKYTGDLGGFSGANAKCNSEFAGSHICSYEELFSSYTNETMQDAWIYNGFDNLNNACDYLSSDRIFLRSSVISSNAITSKTGVAIGSDGYPVFVFRDESGSNIYFRKCNDIHCTSITSRNIDISGSASGDVDITIGSDGYPVMTYYASSYTIFYKCSDISCSTGSSKVFDSTSTGIGTFSGVAIGTDGNPIIAYYATGSDLRAHKCNDLSCSSGTTTTLDSTGTVGLRIGIAIGSDGYPVISYHDSTNGDLKFYKCNNAACTSGTASTLVSTDSVGYGTSIAIGSDGYPVIAHYDITNADLMFYKCNNVACSSGTSSTLDSTGSVGETPSIAIGGDGYPVIAYRD